ncbi:MAG: hypothetical protein KJ955_04650 [Nanoarchaeota archaeon]|nr:hypothetical protein [Nanoarchaeota archaeon]
MNESKLIELFKNKLAKKEYKDVFGYACFFGSMKRDIDFFAIPKKDVKKGQFLKILQEFLEEIKVELKKRGIAVLILPYSVYEEEVEYIGAGKLKNLLKIHSDTFNDVHPPLKELLPILKNSDKILAGSSKAIDELKETKIDYYYNYLFNTNVLLSNYPKSLERKKMLHKAGYVCKYGIGKKPQFKGSARKIFFDCCDLLDNYAYR